MYVLLLLCLGLGIGLAWAFDSISKLSLRLDSQETKMATFQDSIDDLKTAINGYTEKVTAVLNKPVGETVTDAERQEIAELTSTVKAATDALPSADAPTEPE